MQSNEGEGGKKNQVAGRIDQAKAARSSSLQESTNPGQFPSVRISGCDRTACVPGLSLSVTAVLGRRRIDSANLTIMAGREWAVICKLTQKRAFLEAAHLSRIVIGFRFGDEGSFGGVLFPP